VLKVECEISDIFEETNRKLGSGGLLLAAIDQNGNINAMTIGWGLIGRVWSEPIFMVAVRPTRYTHTLIEETNEFTVNVPGEGMEEILNYCGTVSGRDYDKFKELDLTAEKGNSVTSPIITECLAHYECKVVGKSKVIPDLLSSDVKSRYYLSENYHTLYFGKILSTRRKK
jgi:flavin reductase (DIM6/NTAB) family NADH-FMN oxidoreductase RutF